MTRISSFRWTKKDIWMWMNGLPRSLCSRSPRCCFAAPTARGYAPGVARRGQKCSNCGSLKLPHQACGNCGYYKGEEVIKKA